MRLIQPCLIDKMKRILEISKWLTASLALAALCSACSDVAADPDEGMASIPIEYKTSLRTRAATLYSSASDIKIFRVWSMMKDGSPYIPGETMILKDGAFGPEDGQTRYWPAPGEKLGFAAFSGLDAEEKIDFSGDGTSVTLRDYHMVKDIEEKKFEVEKTGMYLNPDREFDLLVAATGELSAPDKSRTSAAVDLNFTHALCCIEFRARNIDPAIDVEITGIGLKHIQNAGNLKVYTVGEKAGSMEWDLSVLSRDTIDDRRRPTFKIPFDKEIELHGKVEAEAKTLSLPGESVVKTNPEKYAMMMIPQKLNAFYPSADGKQPLRPHGSSLMLRANIWNVADGDGEHDGNDKKVWGLNEKEKGEGEWMLIPCGDTWEPGKKYIYTITFGGEGSYGGYEEDEVKDDKDRVFDPIGFKVEIEPWIPGGDIVQNIY